MEYPLISIGIATFNSINTIESCIKSALKQTWDPIEIIIVDDCSSDGTYEKLIEITKKYNLIRVFKNNKNYGIGFVRNLIIDKANGEFLAFFDDDDESIETRLELQYQRIVNYENYLKSSSLVICHSNRKVIYPNGQIRIEKTMGLNEQSQSPYGKAIAKRILLGRPLKNGYGACPTCCQMARISTYRKVGGFDKNFRRSEDTDLCVRLAFKGAHFVGINKPLIFQKMTKSSDKNLEIELKYANLLLKKHKNFIQNNGNYDFCISWQEIKYYFFKRNFKKLVFDLIFLIINYPKETSFRMFQSFRTIQINIDYLLFHK